MMAATAIMATVTAAVVVVMNTGYSVWIAQEGDIDALENGYGVMRHFVRQMIANASRVCPRFRTTSKRSRSRARSFSTSARWRKAKASVSPAAAAAAMAPTSAR